MGEVIENRGIQVVQQGARLFRNGTAVGNVAIACVGLSMRYPYVSLGPWGTGNGVMHRLPTVIALLIQKIEYEARLQRS